MLQRFLSTLLAASGLALPLSLAVPFSAKAEVLQIFTIHNNTGRPIISVYMAPEENRYWGGEFLGDERVLLPGESYTRKLRLPRACTRHRDYIYDIKVTLDGGQTMTQEGVSACDGSFAIGGGSVANNGGNFSNGNVGNPGNMNTGTGNFNNGNAGNGNFGQGGPATTIVPPPVPPPVAMVLPPMFDNLNPGQPLAPNVVAGINVAMSGQGLSPAPCSANPIVLITINNRYTACAYPTSTYAAGRYQMTLSGF